MGATGNITERKRFVAYYMHFYKELIKQLISN